MKWKTILTLPLVSFLLAACGINDNATDDTTARNRAMTQPERVNYSPEDDTGNFGSNATYNYNNVANDADRLDDNNTARHDGGRIANNNRDTANVNNNRNVVNNNGNNGDRNPINVNNIRNNNENRITVADRAADKIAAMREVERANVLVSEDDAYVAVRLAENTRNILTPKLEKRISEIVKASDRDIEDVYVSINPDFYSKTASYIYDFRNGRPTGDPFDEFNTLRRGNITTGQ